MQVEEEKGSTNLDVFFPLHNMRRHPSFSRLFSLIYWAACETPVLHVSQNLLSKSTEAYISHTIECFINVKTLIQDDKFKPHILDIFCINHHTDVSKAFAYAHENREN